MFLFYFDVDGEFFLASSFPSFLSAFEMRIVASLIFFASVGVHALSPDCEITVQEQSEKLWDILVNSVEPQISDGLVRKELNAEEIIALHLGKFEEAVKEAETIVKAACSTVGGASPPNREWVLKIEDRLDDLKADIMTGSRLRDLYFKLFGVDLGWTDSYDVDEIESRLNDIHETMLQMTQTELLLINLCDRNPLFEPMLEELRTKHGHAERSRLYELRDKLSQQKADMEYEMSYPRYNRRNNHYHQ